MPMMGEEWTFLAEIASLFLVLLPAKQPILASKQRKSREFTLNSLRDLAAYGVGLEIVHIHAYVTSSIVGRTTGPPRLLTDGAHVSESSPKSTNGHNGRETSRASAYAYTVSERTIP
jgi:hypothetical protein